MEKCSWMPWLVAIVLGVVLIFAVQKGPESIVLQSQDTEDTISSTGQASLIVEPDEATIYVGYDSGVKSSASIAREEMDRVMNNVIKEIKGLDIAKDKIKSVTYSVGEEYQWINGKSQIIGYRAVQTLEVKIEDFDKVGQVIEKSSSAGANNVYGLSFGIKQETRAAYEKTLLELASKDALERAEAMAKGAGVSIKGVKSLSTEMLYYNPYVSYAAGAESASMKSDSVTPQIEQGSLTLSKNVNAVFVV